MSKLSDWWNESMLNTNLPNDNLEKQNINIPINNLEVLTEEKFDKDIIPTTKLIGLIGSALIGILMLFNGSWVGGLLYAVGGVMATLGLCVLLEGISTIIKLLRKISEK
jgi:hypothetical protein